MLAALCTAVLVLLVALLYRRRKNEHSLLLSMGISGPSTHWLFGNLTDFVQKPMYERYQEWTKIYGKIYGYYEGPTPFLVVSDVDFLKQVFLKQFSSFHARREFMIQHEPDSPNDIHMLMARGKRWKRLRRISNPTFSTAKIKQMSATMNACIDVFMAQLDKRCERGGAIDIYSLFQGLTLDVIARIGFGIDLNSQYNPEEPFLKNCRFLFETTSSPKLLYFIAALFPEVRPFWQNIWNFVKIFQGNPYAWLGDMLDEVVKTRKKMENDNRVDLMRLLIDAEDNDVFDNEELAAMTTDEDVKVMGCTDSGMDRTDLTHTKNGLTQQEIRMQSELFLLAAYETTSTILAYAAYQLALHPEVMLQMQQEISHYVGTDELTYEKVHAMQYMDMVISEVLRIHPVASLITARKCMQACTINGLHIPAGVTVVADIWTIHNDPDLWGPNPQQFDPQRFTKENKQKRHPLAWMPFGAGPRNCIGMRFALMEIKFTLARILLHYNIEICSQTQIPLQLKEGATIVPKDGVAISLVQRNL